MKAELANIRTSFKKELRNSGSLISRWVYGPTIHTREGEEAFNSE